MENKEKYIKTNLGDVIYDRLCNEKPCTLVPVPAAGGKTTAAADVITRFIKDLNAKHKGGIYCTCSIALFAEVFDKVYYFFIDVFGKELGEKKIRESIVPVLSQNQISKRYYDDKNRKTSDFSEVDSSSPFLEYTSELMAKLKEDIRTVNAFLDKYKDKIENLSVRKLVIPSDDLESSDDEAKLMWDKFDIICHKAPIAELYEGNVVPQLEKDKVIEAIDSIRRIIFPLDIIEDDPPKVFLCTQDKLIHPFKAYDFKRNEDGEIVYKNQKGNYAYFVNDFCFSLGFKDNLYNVKKLVDSRKYFFWGDEFDTFFVKLFESSIIEAHSSSKEISGNLNDFFNAFNDKEKIKDNLKTGIDNYEEVRANPENSKTFANIDFIIDELNKVAKRIPEFNFSHNNLLIYQNQGKDKVTTNVFQPLILNQHVRSNSDFYYHKSEDREGYNILKKTDSQEVDIFDLNLELKFLNELKLIYTSIIHLISMLCLEISKIKNIKFLNYSEQLSGNKDHFFYLIYEHFVGRTSSKINSVSVLNYISSQNYRVFLGDKKQKILDSGDYFEYLKRNHNDNDLFPNYSCDYLSSEAREDFDDVRFHVNEEVTNPDNSLLNLLDLKSGSVILSSATLLQDNSYNNFNWKEVLKKSGLSLDSLVVKQTDDTEELFYTPVKDVIPHIVHIERGDSSDSLIDLRNNFEICIEKTQDIIRNDPIFKNKPQALLILASRNLRLKDCTEKTFSSLLGDKIYADPRNNYMFPIFHNKQRNFIVVNISKKNEENIKNLKEAEKLQREATTIFDSPPLLVIYSSYANCGRGKTLEELLSFPIHFNAILSMSNLFSYSKEDNYNLNNKIPFSKFKFIIQNIRLADNLRLKGNSKDVSEVFKTVNKGRFYRCPELCAEFLANLEQATARIARKDFSNQFEDSKHYYFFISDTTINKFQKESDVKMLLREIEKYREHTNSVLFKKLLVELENMFLDSTKEAIVNNDSFIPSFYEDISSRKISISDIEAYKKDLMYSKNTNWQAANNLVRFKNAPVIKSDNPDGWIKPGDKTFNDACYVRGEELLGKINFSQLTSAIVSRDSCYGYSIIGEGNTYDELLENYEKLSGITLPRPETSSEEYFIIPSILKFDLIPEQAEKLSIKYIDKLISEQGFSIVSPEECELFSKEQQLKLFEIADSCIFKDSQKKLEKIIFIDHKNYRDIVSEDYGIKDERNKKIEKICKILDIPKENVLFMYTNISFVEQFDTAPTKYDIPNLLNKNNKIDKTASKRIKNALNWLEQED